MSINVIKEQDYPDIWDLILEDFEIISQEHRKGSTFFVVGKYIINEEFFPNHPELWGDWISDTWIYDPDYGSDDNPSVLYRAVEVEKTVVVKQWIKVESEPMSVSNVNVENVVKEWDTVRQEMMDKLAALLGVEFKKFFEENPKITGIRWHQYTPHFNDGDPCTFGVDLDYIDVEVDGEWFSGDDLDYDKDIKAKYSEEKLKIKEFTKTLSKIPDEVFQTTFGDHVEVTATKSGFETEEYVHD